MLATPRGGVIIPYQEKLGNYNDRDICFSLSLLYHTKKN